MMDASNSKGDPQDSVSHQPQSQADEQNNKVAKAYPLDPISEYVSTLAYSFFPEPGKQGLPTEIRQMIYDEAVSFPWWYSNYKMVFIKDDHVIYYEDTSQALALLRNGSVWENDACNAPEVKLAIQSLTLHVYCGLLDTQNVSTQDNLIGLLKGLDTVFAMDQEHQRASSIAPRKWTAPLSPTVLKNGHLILRLFVVQDPNLRTFEYKDLENEPYILQAPEAFLQTAILQLRRRPVIKIRLFVHYSRHYSRYSRYSRYTPHSRDDDAELWEKYIRTLLTSLSPGIMNTRLPRSEKDCIRYHIALLAHRDQMSYWKERLKCFDGKVQWEKAREDQSPEGPW